MNRWFSWCLGGLGFDAGFVTSSNPSYWRQEDCRIPRDQVKKQNMNEYEAMVWLHHGISTEKNSGSGRARSIVSDHKKPYQWTDGLHRPMLMWSRSPDMMVPQNRTAWRGRSLGQGCTRAWWVLAKVVQITRQHRLRRWKTFQTSIVFAFEPRSPKKKLPGLYVRIDMYYIFDVYLLEFFLLLSRYPPQSEYPGYFLYWPPPTKSFKSKLYRDAPTKHVKRPERSLLR